MGRKKKPIEVTEENGHTTVTIDKDKLNSVIEHYRKDPFEIRGATIDGLFASYKYTHHLDQHTSNKHSVKSEVPVHADMVEAFDKLNVHLAIICEEVNAEFNSLTTLQLDKKNSERIEKFGVSGFRLEGSDDDPQVILVGSKLLSSGDRLKLETPKTKLDQSYKFAHELSDSIDECVREVKLYMNGKRAPEQQQELPFDGEEEEKYAEETL